MKAIILCSWGATSSSLAKAVTDEAKKRNVDLIVDAGGTGEFKKKPECYSAVLLEPQARHLKKEVENTARKCNTPMGIIDMKAFALMDGSKVLDQILKLIKKTECT